ncbi:ABC transporter permease [Ancylobacter sp. MQZ15Z-1]|uniref:ABC transporter permease n=1 Tax=Ancylobacter mangrovi TaxID=2972472 RepID=A0A9X2PGE4_9HYPH|nr:ABC transporter permease [Ancylobacter mangrovi]MCS0496924.1 ABC transporter permease [Ancylobacter mangrovi]
MFRFILADLRRHWAGVVAVTLIVALATALGVVVTLQERALRLGSARAADAFDLVIGAPGSETQLVLSSVFLQAAPLPLMPGSVLAGLVADPRVAWAAPVGFGDFVEGSPIVGTTAALVEGVGGVSEGRGFEHIGDAVIGASVGMRPGDRFHPQHGQVGGPGGVHTEASYHVVGRLKPTGTPWDRAVLVPIQAVWNLHRHEEHEEHGGQGDSEGQGASEAQPGQAEPHSFFAPAPASDEDGHDALGFDAAVDPAAVADAGAPGLPAIVVKPASIADAYKLRQQYRSERTVAVFPGEVLTRLYGTLGDVRFILSMVATGAQALVGAAILLVVTVHILQRRRQIGALRALGAPRHAIFAIVWSEAFAIIGVGLCLGFAVGYGAARALSTAFTAASGITLPVTFEPADLFRLGLLLLVTGIIASLPALLAYRQPPASALRG